MENTITASNPSSQKSAKSVTIIGGGVGGLFTAWKLCKKGFDVTLLERQKYVGGLSTSIHHEGFKIDIGPHFVTLPKESDLINEIQNIIGNENFLEIPYIHQAYRTYFRGKILQRYPTLYETIFNSGISSFIQSLSSYIASRVRVLFSKKTIRTVESYLILTYGAFLYKTWFKPYIDFNYGTTKIPLEIIVNIFPPLSIRRIFKKIRKKTLNSESINSRNPYSYWYFKDGMGSFAFKLQEKIEQLGGKVLCNADVISVKHDGYPKKILFQNDTQQQQIVSDIVVYATPPFITQKWFEKVLNENENSENKLSIHTIMVFLFVNSPLIFNYWVITVYDSTLPFSRIAQQNFLSHAVAPPRKSLLSVEIKLTEDDPIWQLDEESLVSLVKKKLQDAKIIDEKTIEGHKVIKLRNLVQGSQWMNENKWKPLFELISSFENEFFVGTEIDTGILATERIEDETSDLPPVGGFCNALMKSEKLVRNIVSQSNYD